MKIKKKLNNLQPSTIIRHKDGYIVIASPYYNGGYDYREMEIDSNGDLLEIYKAGFITPADLIGDEIVE